MIENLTLEENISKIKQRIDRLETGGKNNELRTAITQVQQNIASGGFHTFEFSLTPNDVNVTINPRGHFYFSAYLGSVHANNLWPKGADGTGNHLLIRVNQWYDKNSIDTQGRASHARLFVGNLDFSNSRTVIIRSRWVYIAGSTGVEAA